MEPPKEPHSVSLKVLRLSRPSLSHQEPLPAETPTIKPQASLAFPSIQSDDQFGLTPLLTLPPSFGTAHVGEAFSCSLCASQERANNDVSTSQSLTAAAPLLTNKTVSSIRIVAEMQTPSQVFPLEPVYTSEDPPPPPESSPDHSGTVPTLGLSVQSIIHFELKEEGNHVLAVNVSYTETPTSSSSTSKQPTSSADASIPSPIPTHARSRSSTTASLGPRVRTFRKLYQFLASPCLSVRTKATELVPREIDDKSLGPYGKAKLVRYALEAQLENVGDGSIVLENTHIHASHPFESTALNTGGVSSVSPSSPSSSLTTSLLPLLHPRATYQLLFLLEQKDQSKSSSGSDETKATTTTTTTTTTKQLQQQLRRDEAGRTMLGTLAIEWRNGMGEKGFLSTGGLFSRKR